MKKNFLLFMFLFLIIVFIVILQFERSLFKVSSGIFIVIFISLIGKRLRKIYNHDY